MKCKKGCKKCNANGCLAAQSGKAILPGTDKIITCKPGCLCTNDAPDQCTSC